MTKSTSTRKDLEKILEHPAMYPLCPDCKKVYDQLEAYISSAVEQARVEGYEECVEVLINLPRKFWEDEDAAVGGYISKKELYELLAKEKNK